MAARWSRREFLSASARLGAFTAAAGGAGGLLEACANAGSGQGKRSAAPVRGGTLVEGTTSDIQSFNPLRSAGTNDQLLYGFLFDPLLSYDAAGNVVPALAQSVPSPAADNLTYTFSLRKDVTWSDGSPLTSDDVVFTYRLMADPAYRDVISTFRGDMEQYVASISAPDRYTVTIKLKQPFSPFLALHATHGILPKHVLGGLTPAQFNASSFFAGPGVVSGVFRFVEWVKGDHITLERNPKYYRGASYLDRWVWKIYAAEAGKLSAMFTGDVLAARIISASNVDAIRSHPDIQVIDYASATVLRYLFQLDPAKPAGRILSSKNVRKALHMAVDRAGIADAIYFKGVGAVAADSEYPLVSWAYNPNTTPRYRFDRAAAESLLDREGWAKGPNGIRQKDGVTLKLEILTSPTTEYSADAQILQQSWKEIGVDSSVKVVAFTQLTDQVTNQRSFDVMIYPVTLNIDPDTALFWHSRNAVKGGQNGMPYVNPALDKLLDQASTTSDRSKRKSLYAQVQDILAEDLPAPPLVAQKGIWAYNKRVNGMGAGSITAWNNIGLRPFMKDVFISQA